MTQFFVTYPPISRCVLHLDRRRCWCTASRLKCLKVYQLSTWDQVQGITYCPWQNSISPSQGYVGGRYSTKRHQHFWWTITCKDVVFQSIDSSEQSAEFQIHITILLQIYLFFSSLCCFFRHLHFSVWRRELLLESRCFWSSPLSFQGKLEVIIQYSVM